MKYEIRKVELNDIDDFLMVNAQCWNETYKGIVEDAFLKKINNELDKNIKKLKCQFNKENDYMYVLIYNNKPVGITWVGNSRIENHLNDGELYSIYLINEVKGKGFGKILFNHDIKILKELGYKNMVLGCIKKNKYANEFYKYMGGIYDFTRTIKIGNQELEENIYYFKDIYK